MLSVPNYSHHPHCRRAWHLNIEDSRCHPYCFFGRLEQPLAATQLPNVCRGIYKDPEDCSVFYRTNQFDFSDLETSHSFLVAIIPFRRRMIRTIAWHRNDCTQTATGNRFEGTGAQLLTMLLECVGLCESSLSYDQLQHHGWP